ncbi:MAG TPA: phosphoglycerate kinase, partial [Candidatus Saccharimonadales bacterium]|nr:phosphoglycerate kinase [Candidatus Saccharimonadales bacterium]
MFNKKTIKDVDISGKRVVLRLDWNVPYDEQGGVTDDFRIKSSLPTINYLLEQGCSLVILSHRGRPENREAQLSMGPVAKKASELIGRDVGFTDGLIEEKVGEQVDNLKSGDILLLENTRFYPEEKAGNE